MTEAPVGNETAVFIRNADSNYAIGLYNTGELVALRPYNDGEEDILLIWTLDAVLQELYTAVNVIAVIYPFDDTQAQLISSLLGNTRLVEFEPVPLDTDIGVSMEKMSADKRYYRRHDRPRIFFDQSVTVNWTWNPITQMFNALYYGDANGFTAPHGVQGILGEDPEDFETWFPRTTCFELNDPNRGEIRGYHVRVVMGKLKDNWRILDILDSCFSTIGDTPNLDDLSDQSVELYGTLYDFKRLNEDDVTTTNNPDLFPLEEDVWDPTKIDP